uniref:Uncharacterized protein n=1 Tax=Rousettus aegyptiacus TaxID=9407 RepID=A0A7J8JIG7_ROUAE|nr:hypothetical protein HJG63_010349 [Rousettus aegyptiacus]
MSQRAGVLWVQGPHAPVPRPPASIAHSRLEVSSAPLWNKAIWSVTQLWGLNGASGTNISQFASALNPVLQRGGGGQAGCFFRFYYTVGSDAAEKYPAGESSRKRRGALGRGGSAPRSLVASS